MASHLSIVIFVMSTIFPTYHSFNVFPPAPLLLPEKELAPPFQNLPLIVKSSSKPNKQSVEKVGPTESMKVGPTESMKSARKKMDFGDPSTTPMRGWIWRDMQTYKRNQPLPYVRVKLPSKDRITLSYPQPSRSLLNRRPVTLLPEEVENNKLVDFAKMIYSKTRNKKARKDMGVQDDFIQLMKRYIVHDKNNWVPPEFRRYQAKNFSFADIYNIKPSSGPTSEVFDVLENCLKPNGSSTFCTTSPKTTTMTAKAEWRSYWRRRRRRDAGMRRQWWKPWRGKSTTTGNNTTTRRGWWPWGGKNAPSGNNTTKRRGWLPWRGKSAPTGNNTTTRRGWWPWGGKKTTTGKSATTYNFNKTDKDGPTFDFYELYNIKKKNESESESDVFENWFKPIVDMNWNGSSTLSTTTSPATTISYWRWRRRWATPQRRQQWKFWSGTTKDDSSSENRKMTPLPPTLDDYELYNLKRENEPESAPIDVWQDFVVGRLFTMNWFGTPTPTTPSTKARIIYIGNQRLVTNIEGF